MLHSLSMCSYIFTDKFNCKCKLALLYTFHVKTDVCSVCNKQLVCWRIILLFMYLQHEGTKCAQVSSVLDCLNRRPFKDFVNFCAALISSEQIGVVVDLLSPEVQIGSSAAIDNKNGSATRGNTTSDAIPGGPSPEEHAKPSFNWRYVMRRNFTLLTKTLDPDNGLIEMLRSKGVISDWNFDEFKVCVNCSDHLFLRRI